MMWMMALFGIVKQLVFGREPRPFKIWFGVGSGARFVIDPISKSQRIIGIDEAELSALFRYHVMHSRTFIDVGSSDGYYPIIALRLNSSLKTIACEPHEPLRRQAHQNLLLNFPANSPDIQWMSAAVGTREGQVTLDQLAKGCSGPFLVKIDVEGAEVDVLRSGQQLLARNDCVVLLEVHSADLELNVIQILESYQYSCRVIKNAWWRCIIPERRQIEHNRWVFAEKSRT